MAFLTGLSRDRSATGGARQYRRAAGGARPLKIRGRAPRFYVIAQLVAQNAGIAMAPEAAALRHLQELPVRMVMLDDAWATRARQLVSYLSQEEPQ